MRYSKIKDHVGATCRDGLHNLVNSVIYWKSCSAQVITFCDSLVTLKVKRSIQYSVYRIIHNTTVYSKCYKSQKKELLKELLK